MSRDVAGCLKEKLESSIKTQETYHGIDYKPRKQMRYKSIAQLRVASTAIPKKKTLKKYSNEQSVILFGCKFDPINIKRNKSATTNNNNSS